MKKITRILSALLVLVLFVSILPMTVFAADVVASGYCGGEGDGTNLTWTLTEDGTMTISGVGTMKDYTYVPENRPPWYEQKDMIQSVMLGDELTTIGDYAFVDCYNLKGVEIPGNVLSVGEASFMDCVRLSSVVIPDNVESIGWNAFTHCYELATVTIGSGVKSIGGSAFTSCDRLTEVIVSDENTEYCDEDGIVFDKAKKKLVCYPGGKRGTEYTVPDGVTAIGNCAFWSCNLLSVIMPDSVMTIGMSAFAYCDRLRSVTIPDSVKNIGLWAFNNCDGLTSVTIPGSVTGIDSGAFIWCDYLQHVYFEGDAPAVHAADENLPSFEADLVTLHYVKGATGWTDSEFYDAEAKTWKGYRLAVWEDEETEKPEDPEDPEDPVEPEEPEDSDDDDGCALPWWMLLGGSGGKSYDDVVRSDWFYDDVDYVSDHGLMNGTSNDLFSPYENTSRAMVVTILYRMAGEPHVYGGSTFTDVADGQWYTNAVIWAAENNIVDGYGNGAFGPNNSVTREQLAAILYRYAQFCGKNIAVGADLSGYADYAQISSWARTAMEWANAEGLINGRTQTTIAPSATANRAELAAILHRFCKKVR